MSSFGDIIALSDEVDGTTAKIINREVSDGIMYVSSVPDRYPKVECVDLFREHESLQICLTTQPSSKTSGLIYHYQSPWILKRSFRDIIEKERWKVSIRLRRPELSLTFA